MASLTTHGRNADERSFVVVLAVAGGVFTPFTRFKESGDFQYPSITDGRFSPLAGAAMSRGCCVKR